MSSQIPDCPEGYRPCVGILLLNQAGGIFVGERIDTPGAWQMPQGGIDKGETAIEAALRELSEETGIASATLLGISDHWRSYDLPPDLAATAWGGRFRGQAQLWAAFRFTGTPTDIDIRTAHPEFSRWKWTDPATLIAEIISFKRDIYTDVLEEFREYVADAP